jgi:hypothetical protein
VRGGGDGDGGDRGQAGREVTSISIPVAPKKLIGPQSAVWATYL